MKKKMILLALCLMVAASGCTGGNDVKSEGAGSDSGQTPSAPAEETVPEESVDEPTQGGDSTPPAAETPDPLEGLVEDEYEGLSIDAAVLERKAILPGSAVPVTITITNNGDKLVRYAQGSGVFETPQALRVEADGLQPVLPRDHLGIATMDYVTKELKPGESLKFVSYVMAAEPNEQFDKYSYDLYNSGEEYIAEKEWADLEALYPDLIAAEPGSYDVSVYFLYFVEEEGVENVLGSPTGYAKAELSIGVMG